MLLALALAADPRLLGPTATYADLVATAARADLGPPTSDCLLQPEADGVRLTARLQPGAFAPPPADWDAALAQDALTSLASPLGLVGSSSASIKLAPLVPVSRSLGLDTEAVLVVTDKGTWLGTIPSRDAFALGGPGVLLKEEDATKVRTTILPSAPAVVVTAEAGVPVKDFAAALSLLSDYKGQVILAAPVTPGTTPQPPVADLPSFAGACRNGISDVPAGQTPGQVPRSQLKALRAQIQAAASTCTAKLPPDGGGWMEVALRLDQRGKATSSCVQADTTGDAALRACVLKAMSAQTLPAPSGGTFVNLASRVTLDPPGIAQHAVCTAAPR